MKSEFDNVKIGELSPKYANEVKRLSFMTPTKDICVFIPKDMTGVRKILNNLLGLKPAECNIDWLTPLEKYQLRDKWLKRIAARTGLSAIEIRQAITDVTDEVIKDKNVNIENDDEFLMIKKPKFVI